MKPIGSLHQNVHESGDIELAELVRGGSVAAFGPLYERHRAAALRCARQLCRCSAAAEDAASEAFAKVLDALLAGGGPTVGFRAYLLTAVRNVAYTAARRGRQVDLVADLDTVAEIRSGWVSPGADSPVVSRLDQALAAAAFDQLPRQWQQILQHTTVEGARPGELAAELGMHRDAVAALAYRARRGLRITYLQAHLDTARVDPWCRSSAPHLGARVREQLSRRSTARVDAHLSWCTRCQARVRDLADTNHRLPA